MRRLFFVISVLLPMTGMLSAQVLRGILSRRGDKTHSISSGGLMRTYHVHTPRGYETGRDKLPVVLGFHGGTAKGSGMPILTGLNVLPDEARFIAVYPEGIDEHWNDGRSSVPNAVDDVGFVRALLDDLAKNYRVDAARIYATGISNGGFFSQRLACDMTDRIAAVAVVAATLGRGMACKQSRPIPILFMNGTNDPIVPYNGGEIEVIGYTIKNGGHTWPGARNMHPST